jgi:hydroxymethylpyrimidine pyrophosphatase-like HAD family hydrolase
LAVKLLAIDIDGTLLDSGGSIPEANRKALECARQRGVVIVLVTGRRFHTAAPIARELNIDSPVVAYNGALIRHALTGKVLYHQPLLPEAAAAAAAVILEHRVDPLLHFALDGPEGRATVGLFIDPDGDWMRKWVRRNRELVDFAPDLIHAVIRRPTCLTAGASPDRASRLVCDLRERLANLRVFETHYPDQNRIFIDVLHPDCSKAEAVAKIAKDLGISPSEVMAVGDNHNDLPLLEAVGTPVVMGNAPESLKQLGFHVTDSNDDAGLAKAINAFL